MTDDPEAALLDAVQADPDDLQARQVYADWLEERGDPRGEYLRLQTQLTVLPPRLAALTERIDPGWIRAVHGRYRVSLDAVGPNKILAIKIVRELTGLGLKEAKDLVESATPSRPAVLRDDLELEQARDIAAKCKDAAMQLRVEPRLPTQPVAPAGPRGYARPYRVWLVGVTDRHATIQLVRDARALGMQDARAVIDAVAAGTPYELASHIDATAAAELGVRFGQVAAIRIERV